MRARTSTRWAACSTSASRARRHSIGRASSRSSTPIFTSAHRGSPTRVRAPDGFDRVIATATAKAPGDRFGDWAALIAAARGALAGERGPRRHVRAGVVGAVALLAAAAGAVALLTGGDRGRAPPVRGSPSAAQVSRSSTRRQARRRARAAARRTVGHRLRRPVGLGAARRSADQVAQIDVATRKRGATVGLPFAPGGLALDRGFVFVTEEGGPGLIRIRHEHGAGLRALDRAGARVRISGPTGIATGAGSVWVARGAEVVRVDARDGSVQHRFPLPVTATLLTFADGALWAASSENGLVEKIDPDSNQIVARAALHGWISALTVAGGSVWVAVVPDNRVFRLSEDDASIEQTTAAGDGPESLSEAAGGLDRQLPRPRAHPDRRTFGRSHDGRCHGSAGLHARGCPVDSRRGCPAGARPGEEGAADPRRPARWRDRARPRVRPLPGGEPAALLDVLQARQLSRRRGVGRRAAGPGRGSRLLSISAIDGPTRSGSARGCASRRPQQSRSAR